MDIENSVMTAWGVEGKAWEWMGESVNGGKQGDSCNTFNNKVKNNNNKNKR